MMQMPGTYLDSIHSLVSEFYWLCEKGNIIIKCLADEFLNFLIVFERTEL